MYYIYEIYNDVTQKRYIGLTKDIMRREGNHFKALQNGNHKADGMQADAIKYGIEHFSVRILEMVETKEEGTFKEGMYMKFYNTMNPELGYNGKDYRFKKRDLSRPFPSNYITDLIRMKKQRFSHVAYELDGRFYYRNGVRKRFKNPKLFTQEERIKLAKILKVPIAELEAGINSES